jgi:hypothetical protein
MIRSSHSLRRAGLQLSAALASGVLLSSGCLDSDIVKRFRDAYAPGFISGLTTALEAPGQAEAGLRELGAALADGLGAIIAPRSPATTGGSSTNSGNSGP